MTMSKISVAPLQPGCRLCWVTSFAEVVVVFTCTRLDLSMLATRITSSSIMRSNSARANLGLSDASHLALP